MSPRPPPRDALTAVKRFGLGPAPGEIAAIAGDPRDAVLRQLADPRPPVIGPSPELLPSHTLHTELRDIRLMRRIARTFGTSAPAANVAASTSANVSQTDGMMAGAPASFPAGPTAPAPTAPARTSPTLAPTNAGGLAAGGFIRDVLRAEAEARIRLARSTASPLAERLVYFWSNHFTVSQRKVPVLCGAYEREAIRPHVFGRFSDLLKAVVQHPAMLLYLDNNASIGPTSKAGARAAVAGRNRGLNENLAREILELHTLGVGGGYTQGDVTNLARLLTGWTVLQEAEVAAERAGRFNFIDNRHEPGKVTVLGKVYGDAGMSAGLAVLDDLARHPSTARHIATRLVRHFVSDAPSSALVGKLETAFLNSGGDLRAVSQALVTAPEAWAHPASKIVPPFDFLVALQRGFALDAPVAETMRLSNILGQPLWNAPSPKGWPDDDDAWISPSPIRERLRIAEAVARKLPKADPRAVLLDVFAGTVTEQTRLAVHRAETRDQALELMIMSPEFMRR
ncbi:MAG: DUF1800 domain-containing protein [Hyphomicrobiaceae bacterium]|nr:DUF1800 domain-containing protein [Hyphomicrobiaceae bacterium]